MVGAFLVGYQRLRLGPINLTLSDAAFVLAFAICLARGQIAREPFGGMTAAWILALVLMLTGLMIGTVVHGNMFRWAVISLQYLFGYLFLPLMLMRVPLAFAHRLIAMFLIGMTVMEVIGIAVSLTLDPQQATALLASDFLEGNGRLSTFASEPNWNGQLIAFTGPFALYALVKRLMAPWVFVIVLAVLLGGLLLSASFTGFAAFSIGMVVALAFLGVRAILGAGLAISVIAAIFLASGAPLPTVFQDRVGGALVDGSLEEAGTYKGRVKLLEQAWDKSGDTIIVGLGVEGFRATHEINQPVHNLFMLMLVDGGLMALLGFTLLVALLFIMPLRYFRRFRVEAGTAVAVACVFTIYTQSMPHMFARLNIVPVLFGLMLIFAGSRQLYPKGVVLTPSAPGRTPNRRMDSRVRR
ncbi:conserved hypothetical protein [Altererythrobacter sp. B11]|nr:conserved hypothetical protein [Altererythrobacter sp. B11]